MGNNGQKLNISTSRTCNYKIMISTLIACRILLKIKWPNMSWPCMTFNHPSILLKSELLLHINPKTPKPRDDMQRKKKELILRLFFIGNSKGLYIVSLLVDFSPIAHCETETVAAALGYCCVFCSACILANTFLIRLSRSVFISASICMPFCESTVSCSDLSSASAMQECREASRSRTRFTFWWYSASMASSWECL